MDKLEINEKFLKLLKSLEELKDWGESLQSAQIDNIIEETKELREEVFKDSQNNEVYSQIIDYIRKHLHRKIDEFLSCL